MKQMEKECPECHFLLQSTFKICPNCGNKDHNKMNVTRRTCGYLGENFWNVGKTKEIKARELHL